jgi:TRAP-type uncharacterized transport system substrate-binding protein
MTKFLSSLVAAFVLAMFSPALAQSQEGQGAYGIAAMRPVIGGACAYCPWGALADKVKTAMKPLGYDVQVCYNCSREDSTRIVSERRMPPPPLPQQMDRPEAPKAPVDFGAVSVDFLSQTYNGTGLYAAEGPRRNLRLIAKIDSPNYYLIAVRAETMITDLGQIRERRLPVRLYVDRRAVPVLEHYGITRKELESWGGTIVSGAEGRLTADVIMHFASSLNNTPESNIWYEVSQKANLRFLELPDDLLKKVVDREDWEVGYVPVKLMRGIDKVLKVPYSSGHVVYGRDDMPDQFAYDVAKALDLGKRDLIFAVLPLSYNSAEVWKTKGGVPLHPGAERYYREVGYMK